MLKFLLNLLKKILGEKRYLFLRRFYFLYLLHPIKFLKKIFYHKKNSDFLENESFLKELKFDLKEISSDLKKDNYDFYDDNLSWHYHLFAGFKQKLKSSNNIKILEIGTFRGKFTNFLSNLFPNSEIHSIDLPFNDKAFKNSYGRHDDNELKSFLNERKSNIDKKNIFFKEMDSKNLLDNYSVKDFDLIWIDGDHLNPQVSIDIFQSLKLIKKNGIICCDDVIKDKLKIKSNYISNDSYNCLNSLEKQNIIFSKFFLKRVHKSNAVLKKYISISYQNNSFLKI